MTSGMWNGLIWYLGFAVCVHYRSGNLNRWQASLHAELGFSIADLFLDGVFVSLFLSSVFSP